jgi:hypothetical protein
VSSSTWRICLDTFWWSDCRNGFYNIYLLPPFFPFCLYIHEVWHAYPTVHFVPLRVRRKIKDTMVLKGCGGLLNSWKEWQRPYIRTKYMKFSIVLKIWRVNHFSQGTMWLLGMYHTEQLQI